MPAVVGRMVGARFLSSGGKNLLQLLLRLPGRGVGSRVFRKPWQRKGYADSYWTIERVRVREVGRSRGRWRVLRQLRAQPSLRRTGRRERSGAHSRGRGNPWERAGGCSVLPSGNGGGSRSPMTRRTPGGGNVGERRVVPTERHARANTAVPSTTFHGRPMVDRYALSCEPQALKAQGSCVQGSTVRFTRSQCTGVAQQGMVPCMDCTAFPRCWYENGVCVCTQVCTACLGPGLNETMPSPGQKTSKPPGFDSELKPRPIPKRRLPMSSLNSVAEHGGLESPA